MLSLVLVLLTTSPALAGPWVEVQAGEPSTGAGVPSSAPVSIEAPAEPRRWWLLVEDLGCRACRAEVYVRSRLVVLQASGEPNTLVELDDLLRPGSNEIMVYVRGPRDAGRMAVSVAQGHVRDEVVVFDGTPIRYALQPDPIPPPVRFAVELPP